MRAARLALVFTLAASSPAFAFTQEGVGGVVPIGHEYLTVQGGLAAGLPEFSSTPWDLLALQHQWLFLALRQNRASEVLRKTDFEAERGLAASFGTNSMSLLSAVLGQRWVDTMGFGKLSNTTAGNLVVHGLVAHPPTCVSLSEIPQNQLDPQPHGSVSGRRSVSVASPLR